MKANIYIVALFASIFTSCAVAQDRTTVTATNSDISDNLDLRAVASIFGDSENLDDFERRLNDPKTKISNLDLNGDNQVDYLRVIESVEGNTHLVVIQSVLGRDVFQDVATVEIEKDLNNNVQVQVVGDVYMYGNNYIYEPIYYQPPLIYNSFWVNNYRPYFSSWYWGYYPTYYYAWNPYPVYTYCHNVNYNINNYHHYNYVNIRRSQRAIALHHGRRANGYETLYPNRSFAQRNTRVSNRHELNQIRTNTTDTPRSAYTATTPRNETPRGSIRNSVATPIRNVQSVSSNLNNDSADNQIAVPTTGGVRSATIYTTDTPRNSIRNSPKSNVSSGNVNVPRPSETTPRNSVKTRTDTNQSNIRQMPQRSYQRTETRQPTLTNRAVPDRSTGSQRSNTIQRTPARR